MKSFLCIALVILLLLTGCAPEAVETIAPVVSTAPQEKLIPDTGGEFFIPLPTGIESLNPLTVRNRQLLTIYSLIYESFVNISPEGKAEASIAQTWSVSDEGDIFTFNIRQGIKWHDGSDLTAEDVMFTLGEIAKLSTGNSPYAKLNSLILNYSMQDEYTVTIAAKSRGYDIMYALDFPVLCKNYYGSGSAMETKNPMGTGPYKVLNYQKDVEMALGVFGEWWRKAPYITSIKAVAMKDNEEELPAYQAGVLDFVVTSVLTAGQYRQYGTTQVTDFMTGYYDCLITNNGGKLSDIAMRQVLAYAIDKADIISKDLMFHAAACDVLLPPDSWLYGGKYKLYEYNPPKSLELIKGLGLEDANEDGYLDSGDFIKSPYTLKLLVVDSDEGFYLNDVAKSIESQLKRIGILVEIVSLPWKEYSQALVNKDFDFALVSYYLDRNPDPSYVVASNGAGNYGGYTSEKMDETLRYAKEQTDEGAIREAYNKYSQLFIDELPHIPLYFRTNSVISESSIKNIGVIREDDIFHNIAEWYILVRPG